MSEDTILVLSQGVHGMPVTDYAAAIRERLPEYDVAVAESRGAERERIAEARIATDRAIDADLLDCASNLRLFACLSAGYGHLPLARLVDAGVAVTNASGVHGPNVAEQTLGWILLYARRLREGLRRQQNHEWRHFQAGELRGSTVTVVGLGAIGEAIVRRLDSFGVHTVGVRYTPAKGGPTDEVVGIESPDFEGVLARTDYLVLACPLTDETEGLLGEREFTTLPSDAVLVNVARGRVVETDALVDALRGGGGIGGAALDVTDPEPLPSDHDLWDLENALVTPHMAGHTPRYYERRADILARNVRRLEEEGPDAELENRIAPPE
jgi:phosphoglycerate dehydrogenase-like enzyme